MRIGMSPAYIPASRPVKFGQQPAPAHDLESQEFAKPISSGNYDDGVTTYHAAIDKAAGRVTVYVQTTRPNPEAVLAAAPQKCNVRLKVGPPLAHTYKMYDPSKTKA